MWCEDLLSSRWRAVSARLPGAPAALYLGFADDDAGVGKNPRRCLARYFAIGLWLVQRLPIILVGFTAGILAWKLAQRMRR